MAKFSVLWHCDPVELAIVPPLRRPLRPERQPDRLRDRLANLVDEAVLELLDPERIQAIAEDMRIVQRQRVHHAGLLLCSVILSAFERSTDTEGRWLDAQRTYEALGGPPSGKTSFRNQARKLLPVMNELLRRRLDQLAQQAPTSALKGRLRDFTLTCSYPTDARSKWPALWPASTRERGKTQN